MSRKSQVKQNPTAPEKTSHLSLIEEQESHPLKWRKIDVKFRTESQEELWKILEKNEITLVTGPAGTGKTYISIMKAIQLLSRDETPYKKIVIIKPAIEADEKLGSLPGTMEEKLDPYLYSYTYLFEKVLGPRKMKKLLDQGIVKIMALTYLRGVNIDDSIVLMDEAQNMSKKSIKTLLTRIGENSKYFILGDVEQSDRFSKLGEMGIYHAMKKLEGVDRIGTFSFKPEDIVRNPIIKKILERLD